VYGIPDKSSIFIGYFGHAMDCAISLHYTAYSLHLKNAKFLDNLVLNKQYCNSAVVHFYWRALYIHIARVKGTFLLAARLFMPLPRVMNVRAVTVSVSPTRQPNVDAMSPTIAVKRPTKKRDNQNVTQPL